MNHRTRYYLAYGSNLNLEQMKERCPTAERIGQAVIADYRLLFRRTYLTIEPASGFSVPVGVFSLAPEDEEHLDFYEAYPDFYRKEMMRVLVEKDDGKKKEIEAMVYIMNDGFPIQGPTIGYLSTVLVGYAEFGFDERRIEEAVEHARRFRGTI